MKELPILMSAPMVRALLDGSKTQTRRVMKNPPTWNTEHKPNGWQWNGRHKGEPALSKWPLDSQIARKLTEVAVCPYGQPGDRLWVRETFVRGWPLGDNGIVDQFDVEGNEKPQHTFYRATSPHLEWCDGGDDCPISTPWKPSIHMPRAASRITLEVTGVRVERLQDISEADARAEGITDGGCTECGNPEPCGCDKPSPDARDAFAGLWMQINGPDSWHENPWVWVVGFKRITP